jgi:hypothetical protein
MPARAVVCPHGRSDDAEIVADNPARLLYASSPPRGGRPLRGAEAMRPFVARRVSTLHEDGATGTREASCESPFQNKTWRKTRMELIASIWPTNAR